MPCKPSSTPTVSFSRSAGPRSRLSSSFLACAAYNSAADGMYSGIRISSSALYPVSFVAAANRLSYAAPDGRAA